MTANTQEVLLDDLTDISAQDLDDVTVFDNTDSDNAADAAILDALLVQLAAVDDTATGPLSVETISPGAFWYISDAVGHIWQVATGVAGALAVSRVNVLTAMVGNATANATKSDKSLFDAAITAAKPDNADKEFKDLKFGADASSAGGILATNRVSSETKAWISGEGTTPLTDGDTATSLRTGDRVDFGGTLYEYLGDDQTRVTAFDYTSRTTLTDLVAGTFIRVHDATGSFEAGDIVEFTGVTPLNNPAGLDLLALIGANAGGAFVIANPELAIDLSDAEQDYATSANWTLAATGYAPDINAGGSVTVEAVDTSNIRSDTTLSVDSTATNNLDAFVAIAAELVNTDYSYTSMSGTQRLFQGDLVRISGTDDNSGNLAGSLSKVFKYVGPELPLLGTEIDFDTLTTAQLGNTLLWEDVSTDIPITDIFPNFGNLADSNAYAYGGVIVTNDVRSDATAQIIGVNVTAGTDVEVAAESKGTMLANLNTKTASVRRKCLGDGRYDCRERTDCNQPCADQRFG